MGVDPVVLRFAAVNGFHVKRMPQNKGDTFTVAEIGQPVPGEDAFDGDDDILAEGSDRFQKRIRIRRHVPMKNDRTSLIENEIELAPLHCGKHEFRGVDRDTYFERANQFRSNADVVACKISFGPPPLFVALRGRLTH